MKLQMNLTSCLIAAATLFGGISTANASGPTLGSAARFALLSTATSHRGAVTCTDSTVVGDVGSSGYVPAVVKTRCLISGVIVAPVTAQVLSDASRAAVQLAATPCRTLLAGTQAGAILPPGNYCFPAAAALTGKITLNGPSTGVWIFKVNGDLTGNSVSVVMANGGNACNVFWAPSGATTMTTSNLKGNVLAGQAVTFTGGSFTGRGFAGKGITVTNVAVTGCGLR